MDYVVLYFVTGLIALWVYSELLKKNYDPLKLNFSNTYSKLIVGYIVWPYVILKISIDECNL